VKIFLSEILGIILGVGFCWFIGQLIGNPYIFFVLLALYGFLYHVFWKEDENG
jgi:uncharacterized membrane protein YccC